MKTAVIAFKRFEEEGMEIASALGAEFLQYSDGIFQRCFTAFSRIIAIMSAGIVVRNVAPLLTDKWHDPAVVVVSPDLRYAIPLIGGHHGANDLAHSLAELGIVPVITTATETAGRSSVENIARKEGYVVVNRDSTRRVNAALLDGDVPVYPISGAGIVFAGPGISFLVRPGSYIVGIGCRRGTAPAEVQSAIHAAFAAVSISPEEVLVYTTTVRKFSEPGIRQAVEGMGGNLVYIEDETINRYRGPTPSRADRIGLSGVAEPAALALAHYGELVLKKRVYGGVTIAIAR